ncbi:uncharacterized protein LOC143429391 isoform X1 [Xylocopa sonorina]|uniref:uncharacterized protein LOC143429391 isoform X1 n=1 Tax=Xylocopa sonorina TaxID=1818115 RepID=UPI00403AFA55
MNMFFNNTSYYRKENQVCAMYGYYENKIMKPITTSIFNYPCDAAMEIDVDGCDYSIASRYLNNDSVILEQPVENQSKAGEKQGQQQAVCDADTLRRKNRKRCNSDLSPTTQQKKFRRGGGKDHVHYNVGSTKNCGSATASYQSEPLNVNTVDDDLGRSIITDKSCCWAAGIHDLLNNSDSKQLLSDSEHTLIEKSIEYEKILFETHGCSMYQFHRLQLVGTDYGEAEF